MHVQSFSSCHAENCNTLAVATDSYVYANGLVVLLLLLLLLLLLPLLHAVPPHARVRICNDTIKRNGKDDAEHAN
jgi:hypothetical protein